MASSTYSGYNINSFAGGINQGVDEMLIKKNSAKDAQNIDVTKGTMKSCKGVELFSSYHSSNISKVEEIIPFFDDADSALLLCGDGKVERFNPLTGDCVLIESGMSDNQYDYVNYKQPVNDGDESKARIVIFGNGIDNTKYYDGSNSANLKMNGWASVADPNNLSPKGKFIELHYERVWISGSTEFPDRLFFSTASQSTLDPHDWTIPLTEEEENMHGGELDMPTWDGGKIIGMKVMFDDVVVFKNYSVFKVYGTDPSSYGVSQIFASKGAIANKSIVTGDAKAFFLTVDGIYMFDGVNVQMISPAIDPLIENLNPSYIENAVGAYSNNKYILAVPEGESSENSTVIEYDTLNKTFMVKRGVKIHSFAMYNNELLFCNGDDNYVYKYDSGETWNGTNIESYWITGATDLGYPDSRKSVQEIYVTASGNGSIRLTCYTDKYPDGKSVVIALESQVKVKKVKIKTKGRLLNFKVENINGSSFEVKSIKPILDVDSD